MKLSEYSWKWGEKRRLARLANINESTLNRIIKGETKCTFQRAKVIKSACKKLNINISFISWIEGVSNDR